MKGDQGYPGWIQQQKLLPSAPDQYNDTYAKPSDTTRDIEISWAAKILPEMDAQSLWDSLLNNTLATSGKGVPSIDDVPRQEFFVLPV